MIFSNIIGKYVPWKGLHIYLDAISCIENRHMHKFEIVGAEGDINGEYILQIHNKIKKLDDNVVVRGFLDNIKEYYDTIDVVVHTSIEADPLPTVLIEAMAKGKIIIASDVGGVREIVDESYGNVVVPPADSEALKDAIQKVANYSKGMLEEIAVKNIERAKSKFSLKRQVDEMQKIYLELCGR